MHEEPGPMKTQDNERGVQEPGIHIENRHLPLSEEVIQEFCRKWNVCTFRFYGSIMRDDFRPDSDVDVMVEFDHSKRTSFFDLDTMREELESLFGRKVDLADRRSVEQSENYIRRKGMLSGRPPVLRQMSYLLDMLICARKIEKITGSSPPEIVDIDEMAFHALSYNVRWLIVSAQRVDAKTREKYQEIPWRTLIRASTAIDTDFFELDRQQVKEIAWQVVPLVIPLLLTIIPPDD
ncbi:MAG: nucleotidyltransferase domain-containing protein [Methanomicrobiales archaeon]